MVRQNPALKLSRKMIEKEVLMFLVAQDADGAQRVYFGALPTDSDEVTLGDLVSAWASKGGR